jgi:uncharacterized protein
LPDEVSVMRLLLIVIAVLLLLAWLKRDRRDASPGDAPPPPGPAVDKARMVSCAHCGLYLPGVDAVQDAAGRPFCCDSHRDAGPLS